MCHIFFLLMTTALVGPGVVASSQSRISAGDRIRVHMEEDLDVNYQGEVSASGTIPVPYLGEFEITGLTPDEAESKLSKELEENLYRKATLTVTLVQQTPGEVYVYGAVRDPGVVGMPQVREFSVLQLISEVGGLTNWAAPDKAYVLRKNADDGSKQRIALNLNEAMTPQKSSNTVTLKSGDVVFVPGIAGKEGDMMSSEGVEVTVVGEVKSPGIVKFSPGERHTLMRAVFKAGGLGKYAKASQVKHIHYKGNNKRQENEVDLKRILDEGRLEEDVEVNSGDMIIVPQKLINF